MKYTAVVLVFHAALCAACWAGLVLLQCSDCLASVWAFGAVKWVVLHTFVSRLMESEAALRHLVVLLCLLEPVVQTGRALRAPYAGPSPDLGGLLLVTGSSWLAFQLWEKLLSQDERKKSQKVDVRGLLLRLMTFFRPDVLQLIAAFTSLFLAVFCQAFIPYYQGKVIDMLRGKVLHSTFYITIGQLALVSLGSALFSGLRGGMFKCVLTRLSKRLRLLLFGTFLWQEVHFFEENHPGRLSARLDSDVDKMGRAVALNANSLARGSVKTCLMLAVMLTLSFQLTVLTCVHILLLAIVNKRYISLNKEMTDRLQECQARNREVALQTIQGIRTVRSFMAEGSEISRYGEALAKMQAVRLEKRIYSVVYGVVRRLLDLGMKILMLLLARTLIFSGQLSIGSLVSFMLYQKPMLTNLMEILVPLGDTLATFGVISKILGYLDRTPRCSPTGDLAPERLEGKVVFQNVTFTYPSAPQDKPALKAVSLELRPGKMTALVGPSGSGKTTAVGLLTRLYEPQEGQILLDGEPLSRYQHKYFHRKTTVVSQNPLMFSGSLRYNITYGLEDVSDQKLRDTVRRTQAQDLLSALEDNYDTDVGEGGVKLAEGQKQLLAVLRALVRDPQLLILDEGTSKLDVEAQNAVLRQVVSGGRTALVVAHQLKTVEEADHIIFMEGGEVVEEGTHLQLMASRGRYHRLREKLFPPAS